VHSCAFARDAAGAERVVSASSDDTVRVWCASSGVQLHSVRAHAAAMCVSPDGGTVAACSHSGELLLWAPPARRVPGQLAQLVRKAMQRARARLSSEGNVAFAA